MTEEKIRESMGKKANRIIALIGRIDNDLALLTKQGGDKTLIGHLTILRKATEDTVEVCEKARATLRVYGLGQAPASEERFLNDRLGQIDEVVQIIEKKAQLS